MRKMKTSLSVWIAAWENTRKANIKKKVEPHKLEKIKNFLPVRGILAK